MSSRLLEGFGPTLAICVILPAMAGTWWRYNFEASTPQPPVLSGTLKTARLEFGGRERTYSLYVPQHLNKLAPLVVALHGAHSDGQKLRAFTGYELDVLADRNGFVVVYPNSLAGDWNDCRVTVTNHARRHGIDDVGFMKALVGEFRSQFDSTGPAYVLGYSDGGQMVYRLALEAPQVFMAAAAIAANLPEEADSDCEASQAPVSLAILNGTEDRIDPFQGGRGTAGSVRSAEDSARYFAGLMGYNGSPRVECLGRSAGDSSSWVEQRTWSGDTGQEVTLLAIHGGGHTIPQPGVRMPRNLGPTSGIIDAPQEVWRFFMRHNIQKMGLSMSVKPVRKTEKGRV
jgi:polyhydroxybutyrate depolymerase